MSEQKRVSCFSREFSGDGCGRWGKEGVFIFKMEDTRAWLYAGGDYSWRQGNTDEDEREEHEDVES